MADDNEHGAGATMEKGGELFKMFFRECFWQPPKKEKKKEFRMSQEIATERRKTFHELCKGVALIWNKPYISFISKPKCVDN